MEDSKMDQINRNVPKTFADRLSGRVRYLFVLTALVAVAAVGYTFLPEAEVSAQQREETKTGVEAPEVATQRMIDFALNLHTASEYTVYAERGIVERGSSTVRGTKGDADRSEAGRKSTKDLSNTIDAIRQLPCTEVRSSDLTGKSFNPGVYCLTSAELAGEMTLDSAGDTTGVYIFRVAGSLNAKSGSSIRLENGAQGGNVFFVAEEAEIGDNASFRANILTKGGTRIGAGASVTDKVLSLGKVEMNNSAVLGGTTGSMEICKEQQLPVTAANSLSNQIFFFAISGSVYTAANPLRVPVGSCSSPFDVTAGPQTVTELNNGALITPSTGTFVGNFELINVANLTPASTSSLGLVNLATRVANVTIVAGGVNTQLTLEFTNRRTITGFIEICKRAATGPGVFNPAGATPLSGGDPDVTGFFDFTIEDVYTVNQQNPNIKTLQIFSIPVGQCTGPIAVTKGDPAPGG
ncbi:MAG: ice-binding family protein, partial [Pyrinomonadaceae bacterium]